MTQNIQPSSPLIVRHAPDRYPAAPEQQDSSKRWRSDLWAHRPPGFPTVFSWLVAGAFRNWPGIGAAVLGGWLLLPVAVGVAVESSIRLAVDALSEEAIIGSGGHGFQAVTLLSAIWASLVGLVRGFMVGLLGPWLYLFSEEFLNGVIVLIGLLLAALVAGLLFLLLTTASEGLIMRLQGARRMSRREEKFLIPLVIDCANSLGLTAIPAVLVDDSREINASAGARHLIINQGLLDAFNYDREAVCGVISHELIHWRNADTLNLRFISGLALPLYASYLFLMWLARPFRHPLLHFLFMLVTVPVTFTVQRIIAPLIAVDARAAEYRADQGAVAASHRIGLRLVLGQLRRTVDGTRNGWDETVLGHHPPIELRLEALEEPGRTYLLPPADAPSGAPVGPDDHRLQPTPPTAPALSSG
jgi:Zn-dependent protease with chaperone function